MLEIRRLCRNFLDGTISRFFAILHLTVVSISSSDVITRYSNFVGVPIYLNGKRVNVIEVSDSGDICLISTE